MATNITAITDTVNGSKNRGPAQFQGLFKAAIPFVFTAEDDTVAAQAGAQCDVSVPGAELGDFVLLAPGADNTSQIIYAQVTTADVVTITTFNIEADDASTAFATPAVWYGVVLKRGSIWGDVG